MYKILIIEDNETVAAILKHVIKQKFNFSIQRANNGLEGLKVIHAFDPDIILLDLFMPLMDGKEFLHKLRRTIKFKNTPVLVITSDNDKETIKELIGLGISDYILKPIDPEATAQRIQTIIDGLKKSELNN